MRTMFDKNEIIICEDHAEIVLRNRKQEEVGRGIIDLEDVEKCKLYKWRLLKTGYVGSGKETLLLHRFVMDYDGELMIDHRDGVKVNCRKYNLRICTNQQNCFNSSVSKRNKSGVTGVYWDKDRNKWLVNIMVDNKTIFLGRRENFDEAVALRKEAEVKYFGEYAKE